MTLKDEILKIICEEDKELYYRLTNCDEGEEYLSVFNSRIANMVGSDYDCFLYSIRTNDDIDPFKLADFGDDMPF